MRIALLTSSLNAGGAERVASTLASAWTQAGHDVLLLPTFSGGGRPFYTVDPGVTVTYLANLVKGNGGGYSRILGYAQRLRALRSQIRQFKPNFVVSFLPNVNVAAIISTVGLEIPIIICERRNPANQKTPWIWEFLCRTLYRFADMVIVQTKDAARDILDCYPALNKVRVVPNPIPTEIGQIVRQTGKTNVKIIVSISRLVPEKQIDHAIIAFSTIAEKYPEWRLHIYGEGPDHEQLECLIRQLGMTNRIALKGNTKEPWQVMAKADLFVMTSRCEGFPNALLEAMAVGLPCLVYDCKSGPKEITRRGQDAVLIPVNDTEALQTQLDRLLSDNKLRAQMSKRAQASVYSRYNTENVLQIWDQLFNELEQSFRNR